MNVVFSDRCHQKGNKREALARTPILIFMISASLMLCGCANGGIGERTQINTSDYPESWAPTSEEIQLMGQVISNKWSVTEKWDAGGHYEKDDRFMFLLDEQNKLEHFFTDVVRIPGKFVEYPLIDSMYKKTGPKSCPFMFALMI